MPHIPLIVGLGLALCQGALAQNPLAGPNSWWPVATRTSCYPHFQCFNVQNGPAWSWVTRRANALDRAQIGRLSPLGGSLPPRPAHSIDPGNRRAKQQALPNVCHFGAMKIDRPFQEAPGVLL